MTELTQEQKDANVLAVVGHALENLRGEAFIVRRRGAISIAGMLGHKLELRDQPWGVVGECTSCGCVAKAAQNGDSIEGRAMTTICPARGRSEP